VVDLEKFLNGFVEKNFSFLTGKMERYRCIALDILATYVSYLQFASQLTLCADNNIFEEVLSLLKAYRLPWASLLCNICKTNKTVLKHFTSLPKRSGWKSGTQKDLFKSCCSCRGIRN